jgi:DNA-binding NtrC family response regulator
MELKALGMSTRIEQERNSAALSILFVDDDQAILESMLHWFTRRGFEAVGVSDAGEAIDALRERTFCVAVLDRSLPESDGLELMGQVRSMAPETKVFVLSGHSSDDDEKEALAQGAFAYLTKPCGLRKLEGLVKSALSHGRAFAS